MMRRHLPLALCAGLALAPAAGLRAEPPVLLSALPVPGEAPEAPLLPIPAEATPEQRAEFQEVIEETRRNDVSVTDQNALLYHGLMLTQDEEYEEAVPFLEEALRRDPSLQPGWEGLGWSYIKLGDLDRAVRLWEYFRRLMPDQALPHALLAQAAILQGDWNAADESFRESLRIKPDQYDVRFWYAQNLMRLGHADEAEKDFRRLFNENPDRLDIALNLATLLSQRLAYDEAVEIYRRINEEIPGNLPFMLDQALLELRVGELRAADQLCLDVLEEDPGNTRAMVLRADIAEIAGQHDIRPFLDIIDQTTDPIARGRLRVRLANRCHIANQRRPGQFRTGFILGLLRDAISDDPHQVEYRILYAERLLEAGRNEECRSWAVGILEQENRHHARAKMLLFELAMRANRYDDAMQILVDRYGSFDSTDPTYHYYKARLYTARGDFIEALREIDDMEAAAQKGAVLKLVYPGLTESDWTPVTSVRRLHEHILSLQREGFTLVSPADIPSLIGLEKGENRPDPALDVDVPATARFIDTIRYGITGERRFPPRGAPENDPPPNKYFAITFDGDQRSAIVLGTPVAQDFGVPFAIFTPTKPEEDYVPSRAGWQELRDAAASGSWIVGSQLYAALDRQPVDPEGEDVRAPLANRIWVPAKNRLESMNEWDRRMRSEFVDSRAALAREMGDEDCPVPMVAYPYGDVGQYGACNLSALRNPSRSILSEAARIYALGFVPSPGGWSVAGDDLLLVRRYEPNWSDEGSDVVRHAYETHPTFVARRMRAEIAMLMNRPNLANRMLALLRRDGYPEDLCRAMENQIRHHFRNKPLHDVRPLVSAEAGDEPQGDPDDNPQDPEPVPFEPVSAEEEGGEPENLVQALNPEASERPEGRASEAGETGFSGSVEESTPEPLVYLSHPFVGIEGVHSKANDQVEVSGFGVRAGLDLNRNTTLSARASRTRMEQTVRPRWNAIIVTNVPYGKDHYVFRAKTEQATATLSHRTESGAILAATFGFARRTPTKIPPLAGINLQDERNSHVFVPPKEDETWLLTLGARWHPRDNLEVGFLYDHGYVDSCVKFLPYHSVGATLDWRPEDDWFIRTAARYWSYYDDNAMYSGRLESFWETNPDLGIWLGLELSTVSTSEPSDYYWTPYWDQRIMGVIRYLQHWEGYTLRLDLLGGFHRASGRADRQYAVTEEVEKTVYVEGVANTVKEEKEGVYVMEDQDSSWELAWGFNATYERALTQYSDLIIEGSVTALRDYIDHSFLIYFRLHF